MRNTLLVLGIAFIHFSCSLQPADPAPIDPGPVDPRADWPWDSGWISVPIPPGDGVIRGIRVIPDNSRLLLFVDRGIQLPDSTKIIQGFWQTIDGGNWKPLPLPSKAEVLPPIRHKNRFYFGSFDSSIFVTNSDFTETANLSRTNSESDPRFKQNITNIHRIDTNQIIATVTSRSDLDTSYLGWITDSGITPIPIRFDKRVLSLSTIIKTSQGKILAGTIKHLYAGDFQQMNSLPNMISAHYGTPLDWVGSMAEFNGKIWISYANADIIRRNPRTFDFTDSITRYRHIDTFDLDPYGASRGTMDRLFVHDSLLFLCGIGWGARDFNGVWVWNEKRQWFQHTPLIRRGVRYRNSNFDPTYRLEVWRDTLYAATQKSLLKRALADIRRDLERDTLPWSP